MFHGFDYRSGLSGSPQERLAALAGAIEWVLDMQQREAARESTEEGKKRAHRRFNDAVLALSKAFALAAASDDAREVRDEAGFFQTVRAALAKSAPGAGKSSAERDLAVQQIVSRAVVSTEIVDILKAAGMETPDISILSDEFLAEVQGMEKKNLAMEALRKLLNGEIRSQSRVNVVQARAFSERLEEAIARYHTNAITTTEVIQELINLAKDIRAAHRRGEEEGLSREEISFYDALAKNESAVEVMGNDQLRVIAHELLSNLKNNASVDWQHRESARARMRILVKRILRKYGYPPDLQDAAVADRPATGRGPLGKVGRMTTRTLQMQVQDDRLQRIVQPRRPILGTASLLAAAITYLSNTITLDSDAIENHSTSTVQSLRLHYTLFSYWAYYCAMITLITYTVHCKSGTTLPFRLLMLLDLC